VARRRKIAISVSPETLGVADRVAKETGASRSAVFERAVLGLAAAQRRAELSRRYVDAYRRHPEQPAEVRAALAAALTAIAAGPWTDEAR